MQTTSLDISVDNLTSLPPSCLTSALKSSGLVSTKLLDAASEPTLYYEGTIVGEFNKIEVLFNEDYNSMIVSLSCGYLLTPVVTDFKECEFTLVSSGLILKNFKILDFNLLSSNQDTAKFVAKRLLCQSLRGSWEGC